MDYHQLNKVTAFDAYHMLCMDDIFDKKCRATYISTLDLTKGYWQIPFEHGRQRELALVNSLWALRVPCHAIWYGYVPRHFVQDDGLSSLGAEGYSGAFFDDTSAFSDQWDSHVAHYLQVYMQRESHRETKENQYIGFQEIALV